MHTDTGHWLSDQKVWSSLEQCKRPVKRTAATSTASTSTSSSTVIGLPLDCPTKSRLSANLSLSLRHCSSILYLSSFPFLLFLCCCFCSLPLLPSPVIFQCFFLPPFSFFFFSFQCTFNYATAAAAAAALDADFVCLLFLFPFSTLSLLLLAIIKNTHCSFLFSFLLLLLLLFPCR